mmetsp:Transcript_47999/g.71132  ORF Transcript_47999/g.71132 Transcript_47999/m.71132 type:complete len:256 (-) Transcript_47999:363-1130(-)
MKKRVSSNSFHDHLTFRTALLIMFMLAKSTSCFVPSYSPPLTQEKSHKIASTKLSSFPSPCFRSFKTNHFEDTSNDCISLSTKSNDEEESSRRKEKSTDILNEWNKFIAIEQQRLLAGDIVSILTICLLLGLIDAISNPTFFPNGGFAAPIPAVPPTLNLVTNRLSQIGVAWVSSSLKNRGYTESAIITDESSVKCAVTIWLDHCSVRIILALLIAAVSHSSVDGIDLLRQVWVTLLVMTGFRVCYGRENSSTYM